MRPAHPPTQPALGLPTMNRQCEAVRQAVKAKATGFPTLARPDLEKALQMAETAHGWLQEAYKVLKPHHTLAVQVETAGKAAAHLREGIKARITGAMP